MPAEMARRKASLPEKSFRTSLLPAMGLSMQKSCLALAVLLATLCTVGTRHGAALAGDRTTDPRLQRQRTLNDAYHPWTPAATLAEWEQQAAAIRERVLVSTGLWPMPPKAERNAVIHGKRDRGEYTVEKVFFASHPGHYVTGNLYRPTKKADGKRPGILCPHGHWQNGRFYDAGDNDGRAQIDIGAERDMSGARYPLQARMAQLARMGCVVFHYDMVGNADSRQIGHAAGFRDAEAGARLQNALGLQTFNSICALDFLTSLPDVDPERIGVTGSSGGGTQTFMLCAIDPRPKVAFPAVMVSTAMQGGCVCENAEHLRVGINNVAIAALFAPKPLAMSGAARIETGVRAVRPRRPGAREGLPAVQAQLQSRRPRDDVRLVQHVSQPGLHRPHQRGRLLAHRPQGIERVRRRAPAAERRRAGRGAA